MNYIWWACFQIVPCLFLPLWNLIPFCSTESAGLTGTREAPPSRSSSSPSSPSCSRPGPPVQRHSSRLAESYFRSAQSGVEDENHWYWSSCSTQSIKTLWNSSGNMKLILVVYIVNIETRTLLRSSSPWPGNLKAGSWAGFFSPYAVIDTLPSTL